MDQNRQQGPANRHPERKRAQTAAPGRREQAAAPRRGEQAGSRQGVEQRRQGAYASEAAQKAAQAAQRAKLASQRLESERSSSLYPEDSQREQAAQQRARLDYEQRSRRVVQELEFFAQDDESELNKRTRWLIIAVSIVLSVVLLLALFFYVLAQIDKKQEGQVKLQKQSEASSSLLPQQTTSPSNTPNPSLSASSSEALLALPPTSYKPTVAPLSTDPYLNPTVPPATAEQRENYNYPAPPPVQTLPVPDPNYNYTLPIYTEAPLPVIPSPELPATPESAPNNGNAQGDAVEEAVLALPPLAPADELLPGRLDEGEMALSPVGIALAASGGEGQNTIQVIEGSYSEAYASPDRSLVLTKGFYDELSLFANGQALGQIQLSYDSIVPDSLGNNGFWFLEKGQLAYLSLADNVVNTYKHGVQQAIAAAQTKEILLNLKNGGVHILDSQGQDHELLPPNKVEGEVKLSAFSANGQLAIFQDKLNCYIVRRGEGSPQVFTVAKIVEGPCEIRYSHSGAEALIYQVGSESIVRLTPTGKLEKLLLGEDISHNAQLIPAGESSSGVYGRLLLINQNRLILTGSELLNADKRLYGSSIISNDVREAVSAGDSLFWTDSQGALYVSSLAELSVAEPEAQLLAASNCSNLTPLYDGGGVFYLKNNQLWCRYNAAKALLIAPDCKDYLINTDGSRCYVLTQTGGLWVVTPAGTKNLAPDGSYLSLESLAINPFIRRSGNRWLSDKALLWLQNNQVNVESP